MFQPPRCPYIRCRAHTDPTPRFCRSKGFYHPKCRPHPIPRFTCKHCHRSFSRQTFRQDYQDHYPHLNAELYELLCSGMGIRQSARRQFSSKLPRDRNNPLFRINLTNAMARDLNGRLRRRSWLVSKLGKYLKAQLAYFITYRNYVRRRFNEDEEEETPAALLGFVDGAMRVQQLLSWRQTWGRDSIHPLCRRNLNTVSVIQGQPMAAG